jgi:alcohol dehydrogenase
MRLLRSPRLVSAVPTFTSSRSMSPRANQGRVLGHEGVGFIEAVGAGVATFKPGERVIISCISACGRCEYCRKGMYSNCVNGGWILGNTIDGMQAEYVRIPYTDTSLYRVADNTDEEALVMLSDILQKGFECGVLNGKSQPGATVAVVGAGLAALLAAQFFSPSDIIMVDVDDNRLRESKRFGATATVNGTDGKAAEGIMRLTGERGVDSAIEPVGIPVTFGLYENKIVPGGTITNVGMHGSKVDLHLERLWSHNITIG